MTVVRLQGKARFTQKGWDAASRAASGAYAEPLARSLRRICARCCTSRYAGSVMAALELDLTGRVFLVTGANSGVGKSIASFVASRYSNGAPRMLVAQLLREWDTS